MTIRILENAQVFDGVSDDLLENQHILIDEDRIKEVSAQRIESKSAERIDLRGSTVIPGLIDAHVHATDWGASPAELLDQPSSLTTAWAARLLNRMLMRGFTSVRDAAGADFGLAEAVDQGLIEGPRLFFVGNALSPTGGHGDFRTRGDDRLPDPCGCVDRAMSVIADGEPEVRRAARNELRKGAHAIKIMASGGVASPTDPIHNLQFSEAEIRAVVEEASFWGKYVLAHAYTDEAIKRCLEFGVRSIEHANLIKFDSAKLAASKDAFVVPTLVVYSAMHERGEEIGMPQYSLDKLDDITNAGLECLEHLKAAGTKTGFGSDLFGDIQSEQSREFLIRSEVDSNVDVLRSATSVNAALLQMPDELGCIKPGAYADLLVVNGNPLDDLSLLQDQGQHLSHIMKAGEFVKQPRS